MNLLVLACLTEGTGNAVTARRIAAHLETAHRVTLVDTCTLRRREDLDAVVRRGSFDRVVAVHALLAGPFARRTGLPYVLVLGGTDLWEPTHALHEREMAAAVASADALVAFDEVGAARAETRWPSARGRVVVLPQAVDVSEASDFSIRARLGLDAEDRLFVIAAGIRDVKDPAFLAEAFAAWRREDPRAHLVVIGPVLEPAYAPGCLARLDAAGVRYLPALDRPDLLAALRDADAVVNTSKSEGMCGVILEAMALGTPVFARDNAGNAGLVAEGVTGLRFSTPDGFLRAARTTTPTELAAITAVARSRVETAHGLAAERGAWLRLSTPAERRAA